MDGLWFMQDVVPDEEILMQVPCLLESMEFGVRLEVQDGIVLNPGENAGSAVQGKPASDRISRFLSTWARLSV